MSILDREILEYQKTGKELSYIIHKVLSFIFSYIQNRFRMTDDQKNEFILYFYPIMRQAIKNYRDIGSSFEAYICTHVRFQIKSFFKHYSNQKKKELLFTSKQFLKLTQEDKSLLVSSFDVFTSPKPSQLAFLKKNIQQKRTIRMESLRRRILFLVLKNLPCFSETLIDEIANNFGYNKEKLLFIQKQMQERLERRSKRIKFLEQKRNSLLFTLFYLQRQMNHCAEKEMYSSLEKKIARKKQNIRNISRTLSRIPRNISNKDIAYLLNISKGTVDSGIFMLRKQLIHKPIDLETSILYTSHSANSHRDKQHS